jgi:hypothetical protein
MALAAIVGPKVRRYIDRLDSEASSSSNTS